MHLIQCLKCSFFLQVLPEYFLPVIRCSHNDVLDISAKDIKSVRSFFILYSAFFTRFIRSLTFAQAGVPKRQLSRIVSYITLNRDIGMVKLRISASNQGRTEGSKNPRKVRFPPIRFSRTAWVTTEQQPDPNIAITVSGLLLSK